MYRLQSRIATGCLLFATLATATAQTQASCSPPPELASRLALRSAESAASELGAWFAQQGNMACAVFSFERALKANPNSVDALYNLGVALTDAGDARRAVTELEPLVKKAPGLARAHLALGAALRQAGRLTEAESELRAALSLDERSDTAHHELGEVMLSQRRYTAAVSLFRRAVELNDRDISLRISLAEALYASGQAGEAIQLLKQSAADQPKSALAIANLGTLYAREKRFEDAVAQFRVAIDLEPADSISRLSLAKALMSLDRNAEALPVLNELLKRAPSTEARVLRGIVYRGLGQYESAAADLRVAVESEPNDYLARYNLGFVLARLGRLAEARQHLESARQIDPDSQEAQFQLATVLRRLNETEKASQELAIFASRRRHTR